MAKVNADDTSDDAARREARKLLVSIRRDLAALSAFVDAEEANLDRKRLPSQARRPPAADLPGPQLGQELRPPPGEGLRV